mmetsp:Transcript_8130/g.26672  ORF Transcript_8130/g.26672 Transcript_8130/m.26672 type:complete len:208 (+) Transcript_8130:804-1427(+)
MSKFVFAKRNFHLRWSDASGSFPARSAPWPPAPGTPPRRRSRPPSSCGSRRLSSPSPLSARAPSPGTLWATLQPWRRSWRRSWLCSTCARSCSESASASERRVGRKPDSGGRTSAASAATGPRARKGGLCSTLKHRRVWTWPASSAWPTRAKFHGTQGTRPSATTRHSAPSMPASRPPTPGWRASTKRGDWRATGNDGAGGKAWVRA